MFPKLDPVKVSVAAKQLLEKLRGNNEGQGENAKFLDILEVRLYNKNGKLKGYRKVVDVITNAGLAEVAGLMLLDVTGQTAFDYIAIGTGTTTPAAGDTALEYETHRVAGSGSRMDTNVTNDTAKLVATFSGYTGTEAITEAGVLNAAAPGGVLLCRQTFSALNVDWGAGDSVEITEKIVCSGA